MHFGRLQRRADSTGFCLPPFLIGPATHGPRSCVSFVTGVLGSHASRGFDGSADLVREPEIERASMPRQRWFWDGHRVDFEGGAWAGRVYAPRRLPIRFATSLPELVDCCDGGV